jgi:hypothetical protein
MTTNDLAYALVALFEDDDTRIEDAESNDVEIDSARTYDDAGLLTSSDGVVLRLADGTVFQLSIVDATPATF